MAEWRDRGFVPDSDEDDDAEGNTQDTVSPLVGQVEEVQDGFQNVDDIVDNTEVLLQHNQRSPSQQQEQIHEFPLPNNGKVDSVPDTSASVPHLLRLDAPDGYERREKVRSFKQVESYVTAEESIEAELNQEAQNHEPNWEFSVLGMLDSTSTGLSSSPLTQIRSSPATSPSAFDHITQPPMPGTARSPSFEVIIPKHGNDSSSADQSERSEREKQVRMGQRLARSLRQRNPIQLHPYMLESERYRQSLKARGLRPLRIAQARTGASQRATTSETDDAEFEDGEDSQATLRINSSPPPGSDMEMVRLLGNEHTEFANIQRTVADDDEFPDINALLHRKLNGAIQHGAKRLKTALTYSHKAPRQTMAESRNAMEFLRTPQVGSILSSPPHTTPVNRASDDVPDHSPLRSTSVPLDPSQISASSFRFPRGISPTTLERMKKPPEIMKPSTIDIPSEDSDSDLRVEGRSGTASESSSPSTSLASSEDESNEIRQVQKKIRGVLPASWLRLDKQTITKSPGDLISRDHMSQSPITTQQQRGIARTLSRKAFRNSTTPDRPSLPIEISDNSDPSDQELSIRLQSPNHPGSNSLRRALHDEDVTPPISSMHSIQEDNRVDPMLPHLSRRSTSRKSYKKRQSKLKHDHQITQRPLPRTELLRKKGARVSRQPRTTERVSTIGPSARRAYEAKKIAKLSIIDALGPQQESQIKAPLFVRIAAREARHRKDLSRHSPTRKQIRLHTRHDTEDTQQVLRSWREGTIGTLNDLTEPASVVFTDKSSLPERSKASLGQQILQPFHGIQPASHARRVARSEEGVLDIRFQQTKMSKGTAGMKTSGIPNLLAQIFKKSKGPLHSSNRQLQRPWKDRSERPGPHLAQIESLESEFYDDHPQMAFHKSLSSIDRSFHEGEKKRKVSASMNDQLARYLNENDAPSADMLPLGGNASPHLEGHSRKRGQVERSSISHRRRKRPPTQVDAEAIEFRQRNGTFIASDESDGPSIVSDSVAHPTLRGLGPFGTRYTTDFDITPLQIGTYFHESTFIGSGEFISTLKTTSRDLDVNTGQMIVIHEGRQLKWSSWNESVSSDIGLIFSNLSQEVNMMQSQFPTDLGVEFNASTTQAQVTGLLKSIVRYVSISLSFLDPVDRSSFVQRCSRLLQGLFESVTDAKHHTSNERRFIMQILVYSLVLANQVRLISSHATVDISCRLEVEALLKSMSHHLSKYLFEDNLKNIKTFLEMNKHHAERETGVRDGFPEIECIVILIHILRQADLSNGSFWDVVVANVPQNDLEIINDVLVLERLWHTIFALLPLHEFDECGLLEMNRRFRIPCDNWSFIKRLVSRLLIIYHSDPTGPTVTLNLYCRTVFCRCHHLIEFWGWSRCEGIFGTLFDFYAHRNFSPLRNEESRGSPLFLQELDQDPALDTEPEDQSFHIFLKIVAIGLKAMRIVYSEKRIRDIVWRLIPNHGRLYPKDESVRQEDIASLRNHHDLLCTLYWAAPRAVRPRIDIIRNLVQVDTSHREACHVNLRAWSNLVSFQLSTDEQTSSLHPFTSWHDDLTCQVRRQRSLARTEAYAQYTAAASTGHNKISLELLESTIKKNQKNIDAIMADAVTSAEKAMKNARGIASAITLLSRETTAEVFSSFDVKNRRVIELIIHALGIVLRYVQICQGVRYMGFLDGRVLTPFVALEHLNIVTYDALSRLVSNAFGADVLPDDDILLKIIDTWTAVADFTIKNSPKEWINYIGSHSTESWSRLRNTEQTIKFTPYFMARVIATDPECYEENKACFLASWMSSLVDRESMLKFQAELTGHLLTVDRLNALFMNLSFSASEAGYYFIEPAVFKERRLSIITTVLANMQKAYASCSGLPIRQMSSRQEYKDLLKQLMSSMKKNYEEIRQGDAFTGAYVDLVHSVVESLQQYTSDIIPVDRYFTDSSAFPLPTTDPTYVVGWLKNYGLRLSDSGVPKQLAIFIQTVSERAAVDGKASNLIDQLHSAVDDAPEDGTQPTLRAFLVQGIFPAYIGVLFTTVTGWILANPILLASGKVFKTIEYNFNTYNPASINSVISITTTFVDALRQNLEPLIEQPNLFDNAAALKSLACCYQTLIAITAPLDFIQRRSNRATHAVACVMFFKRFAIFFGELMTGRTYEEALSSYLTGPHLTAHAAPFPEIRQFCSHELQQALDTNLVEHEGHYYLTKGSTRKEIFAELGTVETERADLISIVEVFFTSLSQLNVYDEPTVADPISMMAVLL
ncbi:MAG: hypothetical protein M1827_005090 [Pycnora praestabilis]|nr:MAG: hypothetical protein M1827_005090 [Pycnora praestabilis]